MYNTQDGHKFFNWDDLIDYLEETYTLPERFRCYEEMANFLIATGSILEEDP